MARKKDSLALFEVMGRKPKAPAGAKDQLEEKDRKATWRKGKDRG